jgi:hypothetical protein
MWKSAAVALLSALIGCPVAAQDVVTVEGTALLRDGRPFEVHGVQLMSFVAPIEYLRDPPAESCTQGRPPPCPLRSYVRAYEAFGPEILQSAEEFGANTILFKVAEPGVDHEDQVYSPSYVEDLREGVRLARKMGFVVILSMQENRVSGEPGGNGTRSPIPDDGTLRAAVRLAEIFGDDRGVMIELYVEPYAGGRVPLFWEYYIHGGGGYPGVNRIIREMRDAGSQNVVIVEPLGADFSRYPGGIVDPLDQLLFGIHTYFVRVGTRPADWDKHFGDFAETHPLLVTEWNQNTSKVGENERGREDWCESAPMETPLRMFHYFRDKGINGAVGWAFDLPNTIVSDYRGSPRTLEGYRCGEPGGGIGDLFQQYFTDSLPTVREVRRRHREALNEE